MSPPPSRLVSQRGQDKESVLRTQLTVLRFYCENARGDEEVYDLLHTTNPAADIYTKRVKEDLRRKSIERQNSWTQKV